MSCFGGRVGETLVFSAGVLPPQVGVTHIVVMAVTYSLRMATRNQEAPTRAVAAQVCCRLRGASIVAQLPRCLNIQIVLYHALDSRPVSAGVAPCVVPVAAAPAWAAAEGASGSTAAWGCQTRQRREGRLPLCQALEPLRGWSRCRL